MDQNHVLYLPFLLTFLFMIILTLVWMRMLKKSSDKAPKLPPGPPKLPVIGNLHLLVGKLPHQCLTDLANIYGPVMCLQLGQVPTFIFSSPETAKDVLKTHDLNFATRPRLHSQKLISYNYTDLVFAPYGDYLRQIKKICRNELFSPTRVQSFRSIREEEVSNLIRDISSNAEGCTINLKELLCSTGASIISRAAFGEKSRHHEEFIKLLQGIVELLGRLYLVDLFPSLKFLHDLINAIFPKSKKLIQQADRILENILMERRAEKVSGISQTKNLLNVLLDLQDSGELDIPLTTENIKATMMIIFVAGGDAPSLAVEWAMSEMLRNPRAMEKAQAEVRHVFAGKGRVDEAGLEKLEYLPLVIKETLRLHPAAPLLIPKENKERCEINGYKIPAKSKVLVNAWAIGRDPNYWTEPDRFFPERFLNSKIDYKGENFEFIPFGSGRRMCAGISFAPPLMKLQLANLLYHFDWKLPDGQNAEDLDMTEAFGFVNKRKHDLCLVPIPYHPMHSSK